MRPPVEIKDHEEPVSPVKAEGAGSHGDLILAIVSEYNRRRNSAGVRDGIVPDTLQESGLGDSEGSQGNV